MFSEVFTELLSEKELNKKQFAERSGIPYTTVVGWTKLGRLPDFTALVKLADFFNCSVDYLTGRQESYGYANAPAEQPQAEQELIKNYRKLNPENKELISTLTKNLSKKD